MDIHDKYILLRNTCETVGLLLDNPTEETLQRVRILLSTALAKTMIPIMPEHALIPGINDKDFMEIFKS